MTAFHMHRTGTQSGPYEHGHEHAGPGARLEAFATTEAARGNVALRLMGLGTLLAAVSAGVGYVVFGPSGQHQLFRDIGPVTGFSALMTLAVAYIGVLIARRETPSGGARRWVNFWFLAGAGFLLLTFDAPLDLHGKLGGLIETQTTVARDFGFNATSDAVLAVYMLSGLTVAAVYWREMVRHPRVLAHLVVGGAFIAATVGIDGFAAHTSWMWVFEEWVELLGLAWIVGAFAVRLNETRPWAGEITAMVARRRAA